MYSIKAWAPKRKPRMSPESARVAFLTLSRELRYMYKRRGAGARATNIRDRWIQVTRRVQQGSYIYLTLRRLCGYIMCMMLV